MDWHRDKALYSYWGHIPYEFRLWFLCGFPPSLQINFGTIPRLCLSAVTNLDSGFFMVFLRPSRQISGQSLDYVSVPLRISTLVSLWFSSVPPDKFRDNPSIMSQCRYEFRLWFLYGFPPSLQINFGTIPRLSLSAVFSKHFPIFLYINQSCYHATK
jgi:hypothetical protein